MFLTAPVDFLFVPLVYAQEAIYYNTQISGKRSWPAAGGFRQQAMLS